MLINNRKKRRIVDVERRVARVHTKDRPSICKPKSPEEAQLSNGVLSRNIRTYKIPDKTIFGYNGLLAQ